MSAAATQDSHAPLDSGTLRADTPAVDEGAHLLDLARRLHTGLAAVDGIEPLDAGGPSSGIVAVRAGGREQALFETLGTHRIRAAVLEARYHPGLFAERGIERALRLSAHAFNTRQEVDRAVACVAAS